MYWYLVHTKPRQEKTALENLEQQGYQCYLPTILFEGLSGGKLSMKNKPLFPGYLFIRLGQDFASQSWAPVRSTKGVSCLVRFGAEPAKVDDHLIEILRAFEVAAKVKPEPLFKLGERVMFKDGPFVGLEAIYQMTDGDQRVIVLIELLNKLVTMTVLPNRLQKLA